MLVLTPNNVLVPVVHLLVFPVRRNERPVSRLEILPYVAEGARGVGAAG